MCRQVHPVSLGLFNFVNAWSMMFWPLMLADRKGAAVKNRFPLWLGTQVWPLFLSASDTMCHACDTGPLGSFLQPSAVVLHSRRRLLGLSVIHALAQFHPLMRLFFLQLIHSKQSKARVCPWIICDFQVLLDVKQSALSFFSLDIVTLNVTRCSCPKRQ